MQIYAARKKSAAVPAAGEKTAESISKSEMLHLSGAGAPQPMSAALREKFEPGFGADFSNIRISRGRIPDEMGVQAVAKGTDILVDSRAGMDVLGHELAHVVQQAQGRVSSGGFPVVENAGLEHEADVMGARVASGLSAVEGGMSGFGGEAMQIAPMSDASAPAQCKSLKEKKQAKSDIRKANTVESVNDEVGLDVSNKSQAFDRHLADYNKQVAPEKRFFKDKGDVRKQRFLQRHLVGTEEENAELMRQVLLRDGDEGMLPALKQDASRLMAWNPDALWDSEKGAMRSEKEVLANPQEMVNAMVLNKDIHNFSDLIKDGRVNQQSLGMSDEEYAAFQKKLKLNMSLSLPLRHMMNNRIRAGEDARNSMPKMAKKVGFKGRAKLHLPKQSVAYESGGWFGDKFCSDKEYKDRMRSLGFNI